MRKVCVFLAALAITLTAQARDVKLAWDIDDQQNQAENVVAYRVYTKDGANAWQQAKEILLADLVTHEPGERGTVVTLSPGLWKIHVTAVSGAALESQPSNVVDLPPEAPKNLRLSLNFEILPDGTIQSIRIEDYEVLVAALGAGS